MSNTPPTADSSPPAPTHVRYGVGAWLCGLAGILYLDRLCMSQAVVPISKELGLRNDQMSYALMAFTLAYGLFEVPSGRMGDRQGSRLVLVRIVIWWSIFTALTGVVQGLFMLIVVRFLFGAGEAGAFPNAARVISRWFPIAERGRIQGLMLSCSQIGGALAPAGAAALISLIGWRAAFMVFGSLGFFWAIGFLRSFRDDPQAHPGVNEAELQLIRSGGTQSGSEHTAIPWFAVLTNRGILVLCSLMVCGAFYTYFFYSWFSAYLVQARGADNGTSGIIASIVLGGSAVGVLIGGALSDAITKHSSNALRARRYFAASAYFLSATCLFIGIRHENPWFLATFWGLSFCLMHVTLPLWWSVAIPQTGRHVGAIFGLMNGIGVIGAMASQWFAGFYSTYRLDRGYDKRSAWDPMFDVYVVVLCVAGVLWLQYRYRPVEE